MDANALYALLIAHKWIALAALLIGGGVRLVKSDSPVPTWLHLPVWLTAPRARVWIALGGGIVAGVLDRVGNGDEWQPALFWGLSAAMTAIIGHETLVESMRGGRDFFVSKDKFESSNAAKGDQP